MPARVDLHGDPLPHRALARLGTTRFRMGYPMRSVQAVPARKQIVSNHADGMLAVWCAESGKLLRLEDEGHVSFAVSSDGKMFASARLDAVRLWDGETAETLRVLAGHQPLVRRVAFSPNDQYVAALDETSVRVWNVSSGRLARQHVGMSAFEFAPKGDALFVGNEQGQIEQWDLRQDLRRASFALGDGGDLECLAVSPDGTTLLANRGSDVGAIELRTGRVARWLKGHDLPVRRILFTPAGDMAVTCSQDQSIGFWKVATGELLRRIDAHAHCIALSGDGKTVISGGYQGNLRFWNLADRKETLHFSDMARQFSGSFAGQDRVWTGGVDGGLRQWNAETGQLLSMVPLGMPAFGIVASPRDGSVLAARADGEVQEFHPNSHELSHLTHHQSRAFCVALAPDGDLFASGGEDCVVSVGRRSSRNSLFRLEGHLGPVLGLAFSPDGRFLASAGGNSDGSLCFWSATSGALMERAVISPCALGSLVYVVSGQRIVVATGGDVVLWSIPEHKIERRLGVNGCLSVAVSPCGRLMALGHENGTVRVLKRGADKLVWQSDGHRGAVTSLAYSPDGNRLVSTGDDASAIVWSA